MIVHGEVFRPEQLNGFITEDWSGFVTYNIQNDSCEIISLNSLKENQGIGTALMDEVLNEARKQNCRRIFLFTTNDNLHALGFYQQRGFKSLSVWFGCTGGQHRSVYLAEQLARHLRARGGVEVEVRHRELEKVD